MSRLTANYNGGTAFRIECRGHTVTVDQPEDNGGADSAMTPPELFIAALSSCIGHYVASYCKQAKISADGLKVYSDWQSAEKLKRIGEISLKVDLPGLPESRKRAVERVAASCLLHATLLHSPDITIDLVD